MALLPEGPLRGIICSSYHFWGFARMLSEPQGSGLLMKAAATAMPPSLGGGGKARSEEAVFALRAKTAFAPKFDCTVKP